MSYMWENKRKMQFRMSDTNGNNMPQALQLSGQRGGLLLPWAKIPHTSITTNAATATKNNAAIRSKFFVFG